MSEISVREVQNDILSEFPSGGQPKEGKKQTEDAVNVNASLG